MASFGNSEYIIRLLSWNATHAIDDRFKSFEIIIDSDDGDKLTSLISTITNRHPNCIEIIPDSDLFNGILTYGTSPRNTYGGYSEKLQHYCHRITLSSPIQ